MGDLNVEDTFKELGDSIIKGDAPKVVELVNASLEAGVEAGTIINEGMIAGMDVVGELFRTNQYYVPEVLISARAMKGGMEILRPLLAEASVKPTGSVVIGTVRGDLHDIGKNLVAMMLEGAGFDVDDTGIDTHPDEYVQKATDQGSNVIGMSALLTTTMTNMRSTIEAVEAAGLREKVSCIIGGAPVTQRYADEIGADGYAPDAASAVALTKRLLGLAGEEEPPEEAARNLFLEARDALQLAVRSGTGTDAHTSGLDQSRKLAEDARSQGYHSSHVDRLIAEIEREAERSG